MADEMAETPIARDLEGETTHNEKGNGKWKEQHKENEDESTEEQENDTGKITLSLPKEHDEDGDSVDYRCKKCCNRTPCCRDCILKWPRTFAFLFGVVVPLFVLLVIILIFGYFLAVLEAPGEVEANNNVVANETKANIFADAVVNLTTSIPRACFEIYILQSDNDTAIFVNDTETLGEFLLEYLTETDKPILLPDRFSSPVDENSFEIPSDLPDVYIINVTELYEFMDDCGEAAEPLVNRLFEGVATAAEAVGDLMFNWINCVPGATGLDNLLGLGSIPSNAELRPEAQAQYFKETWQADQQALYEQYVKEELEANSTLPYVRALNRSIDDATGEEGCAVNPFGSAWFWFTGKCWELCY
jgi:hypothetical protein